MSDYYSADTASLPLFAQPRARRKDPPASHAAAAKAKSFQAGHAAKILLALEHGPAGQSEIGRRAGLLPHQVNKRLGEMAKAGVIELTGLLCESSSGGKERQWRRNNGR